MPSYVVSLVEPDDHISRKFTFKVGKVPPPPADWWIDGLIGLIEEKLSLLLTLHMS